MNDDITERARRLLDGYPEDIFPPLTHTVTLVQLSSGQPVSVDRVSAHALRVIALPVIADLVAEVERLRGELEYEQGAKARLYGEVATRIAEVERLRQQVEGHEKVVDWADDALARRDARIADLLAERDEARAALADLHTAIGDPEWLEWWTGALADIPETLKIRLERIRAAVEHTQEGAGG